MRKRGELSHASLADQLEWDSWPEENQELAKRVLLGPWLYALPPEVELPPTDTQLGKPKDKDAPE